MNQISLVKVTLISTGVPHDLSAVGWSGSSTLTEFKTVEEGIQAFNKVLSREATERACLVMWVSTELHKTDPEPVGRYGRFWVTLAHYNKKADCMEHYVTSSAKWKK